MPHVPDDMSSSTRRAAAVAPGTGSSTALSRIEHQRPGTDLPLELPPSEWLKAPASHALDIVVAREVMRIDAGRQFSKPDRPCIARLIDSLGDPCGRWALFSPTVRVADAWKVIDSLHLRFHYQIEYRSVTNAGGSIAPGVIKVTLTHAGDTSRLYRGVDVSIALAICRAGLAARLDKRHDPWVDML